MGILRFVLVLLVVVCIVSAQRQLGSGSTSDPRSASSKVPRMATRNGPATMRQSGAGRTMGNRLFMMGVLRQNEMLLPYMMCRTCMEYSSFLNCVMMEMCTFNN
ncbi:uncharacterized protein [Argopecten irradians]|uniref:uncharacterized protein n=1 Tax=Argopecten irradians TaxID=31199 RepID=UPI00371BE633